MKLVELLKLAPQSVLDSYKIKVRDKAIESVKELIVKHNKKIEDYNDEEMESLIKEHENKINESVKVTILSSLLLAAGIKLSFFN